jgi:hypothetical protein
LNRVAAGRRAVWLQRHEKWTHFLSEMFAPRQRILITNDAAAGRNMREKDIPQPRP